MAFVKLLGLVAWSGLCGYEALPTTSVTIRAAVLTPMPGIVEVRTSLRGWQARSQYPLEGRMYLCE